MKQNTYIGVYALIKKGDEALFIKKARGPYTGKWDLPGGGFEFGESPEETLKREIKEETGLDVSSYRLLNVLSNTVTYKKTSGEEVTMHHIGVLYSVEVDSDSEGLKDYADGEDSLGAEWLPIASISEEGFSPFANRVEQYIANS